MESKRGWAAILCLVLGCNSLGEPDGVTPTDNMPAPEERGDVRGTVLDYFTGQPVAAANVSTLGLGSERSATSASDGSYVLDDVPRAGLFFLLATSGSHRATVDDEVWLDEELLEHTVYAISSADAERQHATAGVAQDPNAAIVIVELFAAEGSPLEGLDRSELVLIDPNAGGTVVAEPFFVGALGDIDPSLERSAAHDGRSRAIFLNVPAGFFDLVVTCGGCSPQAEMIKPVPTMPGGATRTTANLGTVSPGGLVTGFDAVYQRLQRGLDGGSGCANCHTQTGSAPQLPFDLEPDAVHAALLTVGGTVNIAIPELSSLLRKPLYELPADHPNATWLSPEHPDYRAILAWIEAGAPR